MSRLPAPRPGSGSTRCWFDRRLRVAAAALFFGIAPLSAGPTRFGPVNEPDELLAFKTKAALAADPALAGLNLFVSVADRVAVIGGPVPDQRTVDQVDLVARGVPGLSAVKVHCWPALGAERFGSQVRDALNLPVLPPLAIPNPVSVRPDPTLTAWNPSRDRDPGAVVVQRPSQPPLAGFLQDPIVAGSPEHKPVIPELPMPVPAGELPTIPPQGVPISPRRPTIATPSLADQVAAVRDRDPRFGWLTITFQSGTAIVSGHADRYTDAKDYAEALRRIPGLDRVIVGEVLRK